MIALCALAACGVESPPPPPKIAPAGVETAPAPEPPKPPPGALWRDDVDRTVDGGVGRFMQRLDVEASLDQGVFQGWRIVSLRGDGYWNGVDLHAGDVVLRVNGMRLETDMNAYDAMQSLKAADHVTVEYLRGGERRELTYRIVPKPGTEPLVPPAQSSSAAAPAVAPGPSSAP